MQLCVWLCGCVGALCAVWVLVSGCFCGCLFHSVGPCFTGRLVKKDRREPKRAIWVDHRLQPRATIPRDRREKKRNVVREWEKQAPKIGSTSDGNLLGQMRRAEVFVYADAEEYVCEEWYMCVHISTCTSVFVMCWCSVSVYGYGK